MKLLNILNKYDPKGLRCWLPAYSFSSLNDLFRQNSSATKHILFCIADHFEPFNGNVSREVAEGRVKFWLNKYPPLAKKFKDADLKHPQHTWFYPPHHDRVFLKDLLELCRQGFGEIEMHLHHNHMDPFPDTPETLKNKIEKCLDDYSGHGIFCLPGGERKFAFIHGDWSLDNSRGASFCGVNNELKILSECGCYADFTFPALLNSQPAKVNKMYYATGSDNSSKGYNWGKEVVAGIPQNGNLLIVQGTIGLYWPPTEKRLLPSIEVSNIDRSDTLTEQRIDRLVKNAVRIKGAPDWYFIKLHTHGAKNADSGFHYGSPFEPIHEYLLNKYNDGKKYMLHYVTAREMVNIIKAAEAGLKGNPNQYRDFYIPRYVYLPKEVVTK